MSEEPFLNAYHNASTPPPPDLRPDLAAFMLAADPVLSDAAEIARVLVRAHQAAAVFLPPASHPTYRVRIASFSTGEGPPCRMSVMRSGLRTPSSPGPSSLKESRI
jgi:hypothetical protein